MDRITKALLYAMEKHEGQIYDRKIGGYPYIAHPIRVALRLGEDSELAIVVALLHDVLEDTNATHEELVCEFGDVVARMVQRLTRDKSTGTYAEYIRHVAIWPLARRVKIVDIEDNLDHCYGENAPERASSLIPRYNRALEYLTHSYQYDEPEPFMELSF